MVDSIMFRIHDLKKHYTLAEFLMKPDSGVYQMAKSIDDPERPMREVEFKRYFLDVKTGRSWPEKYRNFIKSHHYHIAYSIDTSKDSGFIEFNMSLPKYHYGTNVLQTVDHFDEPNYIDYRNNDFWNCKRKSFDKFIAIWRKFVEKELGGYYHPETGTGTVHKSCVEIIRLDLCFNLAFNTESDAMFYLQQVSTIKKRGVRDTSSIQRNYHSGIYFSSKDFTVKVYLKGTEFKKHDYSKVKKRFGGKVAEEIYHRAKRILRYEVEFRPGYMTELFMTNLKETNPLAYKCVAFSRNFSRDGFINHNNVRYSWDGQPVGGRPCAKMPPDIRTMLKNGDYIRKRDFHFIGALNPSYSLEATGLDDIENQYQYKEAFTFELFCLLVDSFKKHFLHFQLGNFENLNVIENVLNQNRQDNAERGALIMVGKTLANVGTKGINKQKVRQLIYLLHDHSWDEIRKMTIFSDRVFYRYKKFFAECGLKAQRSHELDFKVKFDYSNYFDLVFDIYNMIKVNPMFSTPEFQGEDPLKYMRPTDADQPVRGFKHPPLELP